MSSVFSGSAGRKASIAQGQILQDGKNEAYGFLDQGQTDSLASLGRGYDAGRYNIYDTTDKALSNLGSNYQQALNEQQGAYGTAQGYYAPLSGAANAGYGLYADATGANGADGYSRAKQSFQTGPGYEFMQQQAADNAARSASALGIAGSGNTLQAITDRSSNLANQEYGNWLNRLSSWQTLAPQLAGAQASLASNYGNNRANMMYGYGQDMSNTLQNHGRTLAGLNTGQGTGEASIYGSVAGNKAQSAIGVADKMGEIVSGGMMAGQQAAANRLNFGMGLANLGASLLGGASGGKGSGGGFLSGLSGLFK